MSRIKELFTYSTSNKGIDWGKITETQFCRYTCKKCYKVRKSISDISIGTCTVQYGKDNRNIIICPQRLLENKQIFIDCIHLLTSHIPGNELHVISEVSIPGGSVDYFLVSTDSNHKVKDFIGIELQTMDTTGSVWYERELTLNELGVKDTINAQESNYGINWKMTAKTILVQLNHKIKTFENLNKHFVLIIQDCLLDYIKREFSTEHISLHPTLGDSMHFHSYKLRNNEDGSFKLILDNRCSTDSIGISKLLGLKADANIKLGEIVNLLESKISERTLLGIG